VKNGEAVGQFEREFAEYVGAKYAIALCNGTATLHTALAALCVKPGERVAVPPLTMSATTIAVLQAGALPVFCDVDERTWLMRPQSADWSMPVSLYGLHCQFAAGAEKECIDDAAQTLRPHGHSAFTSYSFQASKILALGEGGMLVTNDEALAVRAREFSSLGYQMRADQPRIDPKVLKSPTFARHHTYPAWNYRMADVVAMRGLIKLKRTGELKSTRLMAAEMYADAVEDCEWLTPQHVPAGWSHSWWTYAFAVKDAKLWHPLTEAMVRHGAEMPYACWRLTYQEPAFRHLAPDGTCPVAENLQPRLIQCQTNDLAAAERNAKALRLALQDVERSQLC
jgi:perosamine synthetase